MAETILFSIAREVLVKLGSLAVQEIGLAKDVKSDIKRLQDTMSTIYAVLLDAEKQQTTSHAVRDWLEKLKDVVYDIDDVLDEISTEALHQKVEIHGSMLKEVSNFFSRSNPLAFRSEIGHKIKHIRERLDKIATDRRDFHFTDRSTDARVENRREQTHSFVPESDVIGRDDDKEHIVELLLESSNGESPSVIPIVGLGGLGKTTLAKLVYNDFRVMQNFELSMWVCVSEDFDIKKLIEKILKSAIGENFADSELDQLQKCLRDVLKARKFLLVLDDVWNDDPRKWTELRNLLLGGARGSKIIVTTRIMTTASIMGTIPPYKVRVLSDDECLSILMKCAFKEGHDKGHPKLVEIGKKIVTKCGGIPLAVKTLGCLLHMKTDEREWLYIKDNEIWKLEQKENDILPALRLSYQQFPSYLRQCFAYCSIFPKDFIMSREDLINNWIAQGFLQSHNGGRELEDIGNQYFNELMSRSFFEDVVTSFDSEINTCKMHHLVHDLAQSVAGVECMKLNFNSTIISEKVRYVSFSEYNFYGKEFPTSLLVAKKLRSFRFSYKVGLISKSFIDRLVLRFRCLRVLDLGDSQFEELPSFVGHLKHLRYLGLTENRRLKALANSICKLLNLQTLYLYGCDQLQALPKDIGKLINLRCLFLTSQLVCMPEKGLKGLTSLRCLFLYRCNRLTSLPEGIQHLTSLRTLRILECSSLTSLPSGMKHLTALEKLEIIDCPELNLLEDEDMRGLHSLRSLGIRGLPKLVSLPQGLQHSATALQYLSIRNCPGLTTLPEWLEVFTSLQLLDIWDCPNLSCLPQGMQSLTAMQELYIRRCPQFRERCKKNMGEDWPKIAHIPKIYMVLY